MSNATAERLPLLKHYSRAPSRFIVRISAAGYRFQWPEPSASSGLAAVLRNRPRAQCGVSLSEQGRAQQGRLSDRGPLIAAQAAAASSKTSARAGWASGWAGAWRLCRDFGFQSKQPVDCLRTRQKMQRVLLARSITANSGVPLGLGGCGRGLGGAPAQKKNEHPEKKKKPTAAAATC